MYLFVGVLGHGDHKASRVLSSFSFKPPFFPEAGNQKNKKKITKK